MAELDPREGPEFFLNIPAKLDNPYADFAYFRRHRPVFYYEPMNTWFIFRYEDVERLFMDPRLSSKRMDAFIEGAPADMREEIRGFTRIFDRWVLMLDGPEHSRLRKLLHRGFSPRVVATFQEMITELANELLDRVQGHGAMDAAADFAHPLPVMVICGLLGVPRGERDRVMHWADSIADFFNDLPITARNTQRFKGSSAEMITSVRGLIAARRAEPKGDFLSELVQAQEDGQGLTEEEILANCIVLLIAGHETTRNLIGNAVYLLLTHPEQLTRLRRDPSLYRNAIEETLRFESVHPMMPRIAAEDFALHGQQIRKGQFVYLCMGSSNRDPDHFPDPDVYDITKQPDKHLAFGIGPHFCLGAPLARQEAQIALQTLLTRMPNLKLDERRPPQWQRIANLRGPRSLPVVF